MHNYRVKGLCGGRCQNDQQADFELRASEEVKDALFWAMKTA